MQVYFPQYADLISSVFSHSVDDQDFMPIHEIKYTSVSFTYTRGQPWANVPGAVGNVSSVAVRGQGLFCHDLLIPWIKQAAFLSQALVFIDQAMAAICDLWCFLPNMIFKLIAMFGFMCS